MSEQTIHSRDIRISKVFQAFYSVPEYQREYVWEAEQVEQLLSDINSELAGSDPASAPEYFIGSIVVCPGQDGILELIDGQQRMTTIFLTLCAIRDRLIELGAEPSTALGAQIAATSVDVSGNEHFRYRLDLQYEDSGDVLSRIAARNGERAGMQKTRSVANILNAYEVVLTFLRREFGDDVADQRAFYGYVINKVKLIRIRTEDVAKALKIFETINDRGVGLDSMDLLKNLLFMRARRTDFDKLKGSWKELQDTIFEMGEKPLRFLRYYIFSHYDVDVLREDQIYGWLAKNEARCGYGTNPLGFAADLLAGAKAYRNFLSGRDEHGAKNRFLENLQLLGGRAARQHLILLLAGRHLDKPLFDRLASEVEDLFFVYVITREPTRDFERNFARWAMELRKVRTEPELQEFIDRRFRPTKVELSDRFAEAFRRLQAGAVQQYRLRYILAKLSQHIELEAYGETEGTRWLASYTGSDLEIEHIFPQQPSEAAAGEFGAFDDPQVTDRLGNLVLVEKSINASLGNRPYSQKRDVYRHSQLLLTKSLSEPPKIGTNTKIDIAVARLNPFPEWNAAAVAERQDRLSILAKSVWRVPEARQTERPLASAGMTP